MAEPFLAEIRLMSFNFAPRGWALCNGQLLPINQNQALFALLGTTYGGNGQTTFALPDLRERVPIHVGQGHTLGERSGEQAHTLSIAELPGHTHAASAVNAQATSDTPDTTKMLAKSRGTALYAPRDQSLVAMANTAVTTAGSSQPHQNMQPYLALNFSIALQGIFPSQT